MGFSKLFKTPTVAPVAAPATVEQEPPTVSETQENDTQADYAQRSAHKRGLLSTILTKRQYAGAGQSGNGGNTTLG